MNLFWKNFAQQYNFTIDNKCLYGVIDNYQVFIHTPSYTYGIVANIKDKKDEIVKWLEENNKSMSAGNYIITDYYVAFRILVNWTFTGTKNKILDVLQNMALAFKKLEILDCNYSPVDGSLLTTKTLVYIHHAPVIVNEETKQIVDEINQNQGKEFKKAAIFYCAIIAAALIGVGLGFLLFSLFI